MKNLNFLKPRVNLVCLSRQSKRLQFFRNETFEKDNLCLTKSPNKLLCTWKATKDCSHSYWKTSVVFWLPKMSVFFWLFPWKKLKVFHGKTKKNTDILGCQKKLMILTCASQSVFLLFIVNFVEMQGVQWQLGPGDFLVCTPPFHLSVRTRLTSSWDAGSLI